MALSDLIHKRKTRQVATATVATPATNESVAEGAVANVASVAVASPAELQNEVITVVCYTPAGNPISVLAKDAEHAKFLERMNPPSSKILEPGWQDSDDRRSCSECGNLSSGGRCLAAWRGEIEADTHYKPVDDCPRRCIGFVPKTNEPDQRSGIERWPGLKNK